MDAGRAGERAAGGDTEEERKEGEDTVIQD